MSHSQQDRTRPIHTDADTITSDGDMLRRTLARGRKLRVCVVGAGVAGLRSADILTANGAHVTILEARNRVGGRTDEEKVGQSSLQGHKVDLGANWLHGHSEGNPILDLAKKTGTQLHSWSERQIVFNEDGKPIPGDEVAETAESFWGLIAEGLKYSNEQREQIPVDRSLMDFVKEKASQTYLDEPAAEQARKRKLLLREAEMWGAFVGGAIDRQSLRFFWLEEGIEGENPFIADTYGKILDAIAAPAQAKARILLEHQVTSITNKTVDGSDCVEVNTANGYQDAFDEVVVTLPLGCLQQKKDIFTPPLPEHLSKAIDAIGYGNLDKVYITFSSAFWNHSSLDSTSIVPPKAQDETPNIRVTTAPLHQGDNSGPSADQYPGFNHFIHPYYAPTTNPQHWSQQAMNLAALPPSSAQPTLLFYVFGDCAKHIARLTTSTQPHQLASVLIDFFEPYFSLLPNYSVTDPACQAEEVLATAWAADEYAGYGSYSNFQVGLETGDKDIECMREGLPDRHLWLAGEHTSPFIALGTVTGAYWAGEGVAKRIVNAYGLQPESDGP